MFQYHHSFVVYVDCKEILILDITSTQQVQKESTKLREKKTDSSFILHDDKIKLLCFNAFPIELQC